MIGINCNIVFYKDDMRKIIEEYTLESGIRHIKKIIERINQEPLKIETKEPIKLSESKVNHIITKQFFYSLII